MTNLPMMLDLGALLLLLLFVLAGIRKGLVVSLCSLLAVVVALVGSLFIAREFSPMLIDYATPKLASAIERRLPEGIQATKESLVAGQIEKTLEQSGLPKGIAKAAQDQILSNSGDAERPINSVMAEYAVKTLAYSGIFLISYILFLLIWKIISHTLDLMTRLPVLNFCNRGLGAVFGLGKGLIILAVLQWVLCDFSGVITTEIMQETTLLKLFSTLPALTWETFGKLHK